MGVGWCGDSYSRNNAMIALPEHFDNVYINVCHKHETEDSREGFANGATVKTDADL